MPNSVGEVFGHEIVDRIFRVAQLEREGVLVDAADSEVLIGLIDKAGAEMLEIGDFGEEVGITVVALDLGSDTAAVENDAIAELRRKPITFRSSSVSSGFRVMAAAA